MPVLSLPRDSLQVSHDRHGEQWRAGIAAASVGMFGYRVTGLTRTVVSWSHGGARATPSTTGPSEEAFESVERLYDFRDYTSVAAFLRQHPFLVGILLEAYERIQSYFGVGTQVVLELFSQPDNVDAQELFALIRTNLEPKEVIARLEAFDNEWWLDALPEARHKMTIDVEYV